MSIFIYMQFTASFFDLAIPVPINESHSSDYKIDINNNIINVKQRQNSPETRENKI